MTETKVLDSKQLMATSQTIQNLAVDVQENFKKIQEDLDQTIGTDIWAGERASDFKAKWDEFATCFKPVVDKIMEISIKAQKSARTLEEYTEKTI